MTLKEKAVQVRDSPLPLFFCTKEDILYACLSLPPPTTEQIPGAHVCVVRGKGAVGQGRGSFLGLERGRSADCSQV